jgi:uncharacterized membrane protein SirB2
VDWISSFTVWLSDTEWSIQLHESLYAYTLIESAHVIGIMLFVGTIVMVDLRLLGLAWREVPVSEMNARILPWTIAGFVLMFVTGVLLFYAIPVRSWHSVWFRTKMILLIIAAINVWLFHRRVERDRASWDMAPRPPLNARISAGVSLALWLSVIVLGRMIAYNWFDCDKPQSAFVQAFASCDTYPKDVF